MHSVLRVWRGGRAGRGAGISPERSEVAAGANLAFCIDGVGDGPKINMNGKTLTLPEKGTVTVSISNPAEKKMRTTSQYVLIANAGLEDASKFVLGGNTPTWVEDLAVVGGNLVLTTKQPGLSISVR